MLNISVTSGLITFFVAFNISFLIFTSSLHRSYHFGTRSSIPNLSQLDRYFTYKKKNRIQNEMGAIGQMIVLRKYAKHNNMKQKQKKGRKKRKTLIVFHNYITTCVFVAMWVHIIHVPCNAVGHDVTITYFHLFSWKYVDFGCFSHISLILLYFQRSSCQNQQKKKGEAQNIFSRDFFWMKSGCFLLLYSRGNTYTSH